jgi:hypothetical protein
VSEEVLFEYYVKSAFSVEGHRVDTGGNAALMATQLVKEGVAVMLGGQVGNKLKSLLDTHIQVSKYFLRYRLALFHFCSSCFVDLSAVGT